MIARVAVGPGFVSREIDCSEDLVRALLLGDAGLDGLDDGGQISLLAFQRVNGPLYTVTRNKRWQD